MMTIKTQDRLPGRSKHLIIQLINSYFKNSVQMDPQELIKTTDC